MRLLDRYLLRELVVPLGYCLGGFLIFWISFDLFSELKSFQDLNLTVADVAALYVVKIPGFLVLVLPIALLLALLYTLTNHARANEITAMRAAGVSLWRICVPYLAIGFLLTLALFVMNEFWVPYSAEKEEQISGRHAGREKGGTGPEVQQSLGFENARDGHHWQMSSYNWATAVMTDPHVSWRMPDGTTIWLIAGRAERVNNEWVFYDNVIESEIDRDSTQTKRLLQTNVLAVTNLTETPGEFKREITFSKRFSKPTQPLEIPIVEILDYLDLHPNLSAKNRSWLLTQLQDRFAKPWTCLVVVLIAIPFGAASGRRNMFSGVAGSIFICFAYFIFLKLGLAMGSGGTLPPWLGAWLPNLVFGLTGLVLITRVR